MEEETDSNDFKRKCLNELGISRPIKGVKERLAGKDGQIRSNMMGKVCPSDTKSIASLYRQDGL